MNRIISLDVLRGLTVIGMILVNNAWGGSPAFLHHLPWNGCTAADLVFPFFLFIVGASLWFATRKTQHTLDKKLVFHILKRGLIIFVIGLLLNWFPFRSSWEYLRIPGVLQRIALVYVFASFLCLWLKSYKKLIIASLVILLGYWGLLAVTDGLTVSGLADNIVRRIDVAVFGKKHILSSHGYPFDPEGLLSTLPAIVNAILGYLFAKFLGTRELRPANITAIFCLGAGMILLALLWDNVLPFNKKLWSSSYVLYTSGWAAVLWAPLAWIIDLKGAVLWSSFFRVFGANTLLAYILSMLIEKCNRAFPFLVDGKKTTVSAWLADNVYSPLASGTPLYPLLWAITVILLCWAVTYPLYKFRIYVKI